MLFGHSQAVDESKPQLNDQSSRAKSGSKAKSKGRAKGNGGSSASLKPTPSLPSKALPPPVSTLLYNDIVCKHLFAQCIGLSFHIIHHFEDQVSYEAQQTVKCLRLCGLELQVKPAPRIGSLPGGDMEGKVHADSNFLCCTLTAGL